MLDNEHDKQLILQALEQALESAFFSTSSRQSKFLTFIVEYSLENPGAKLSANVISSECFNRPVSADPNCPYIRNIASKTRRTLANFYQSRECVSKIEISLPLGTYCPTYRAIDETGRLPSAKLEAATTIQPSSAAKINPSDLYTHRQTAAAESRLLPAIAVLPLMCRLGSEQDAVIGELIADSLITSLAKSRQLQVISRHTTSLFRNSEESAYALGKKLQVEYLFSGTYYVHRGRLKVDIELCECEYEEVLWAESYNVTVDAMVEEIDDLIPGLLRNISDAITRTEIQRVIRMPLRSVQCHSLYVTGINYMYRSAKSDYDKAKPLFEELSRRNPKHAAAHAYLARWATFGFYRENNSDTDLESQSAYIKRKTEDALERDSRNPVALSARGLMQLQLEKDMPAALQTFQSALQESPDRPSILSMLSLTQSYTGASGTAIKTVEKAIKLSPFDPAMYFYLSTASAAALINGQPLEACKYAERSAIFMPNNTANLRLLIASYSAIGQMDKALGATQELLQLDPGFSIQKYCKHVPFAKSGPASVLIQRMRENGVPEH